MHSRNLRIEKLSIQRNQRGVVLIVGLIMVLLITIVGLSSIRGSGLQESMAGNMRDRNIAFQAAESALREAEEVLAPNNALPAFDGTSGLHTDLTKTPEFSVWFFTKTDWEDTAKVKPIDTELKFVASDPVYLIEELEVDIGSSAAAEGSAIDVGGIQTTGDATPYRITSRGVGGSTDTEVVLQSTYKRRFQ